jgi:hypothetical protein
VPAIGQEDFRADGRDILGRLFDRAQVSAIQWKGIIIEHDDPLAAGSFNTDVARGSALVALPPHHANCNPVRKRCLDLRRRTGCIINNEDFGPANGIVRLQPRQLRERLLQALDPVVSGKHVRNHCSAAATGRRGSAIEACRR